MFSLGCGRVFEGDPGQMLASLDQIAARPDHTEVYCAHEYTLANARFAAAVEPSNAELAQYIAAVRRRRDLGQASVPTQLGVERRCNPFLRCSEPTVRAAAEAHAGRALAERVEVFAELRAWKNSC